MANPMTEYWLKPAPRRQLDLHPDDWEDIWLALNWGILYLEEYRKLLLSRPPGIREDTHLVQAIDYHKYALKLIGEPT